MKILTTKITIYVQGHTKGFKYNKVYEQNFLKMHYILLSLHYPKYNEIDMNISDAQKRVLFKKSYEKC